MRNTITRWIPIAALLLANAGCGSKSQATPGGEDAGAMLPPADASGDAAPPSPSPMPQPLSLFGNATGPDGHIYVVGGYGVISVAAGVVAYDPSTNSWTSGADSPGGGRYALAATAGKDGRIYAFGGTRTGMSGALTSARAEAYDPKTDTWESLPDMPTPRFGLAAATDAAGLIYAIGGGNESKEPLDVVEVYSTVTKTWSVAAPLPTKRLSLGAALGADGHLYAIGGRDALSAPIAAVESFDPSSGKWSTEKSLPTARFFLGVTAASDGNIYTAGGFGSADGIHFGFVDTVEAYSPTAHTWSTVNSMPQPRAWASAAAVDGRVYVIGGSTDVASAQPRPTATVISYGLVKSDWVQ